ncbi:MAG: hypothetical protein ACYC6A_07020 [Armatimonadota bacterium]
MSRNKRHTEERTSLSRIRNVHNPLKTEEVLGYKMSEVFIDFADPFMEDAVAMDDIRSVYSLAAIAWNLALLPPHERLRILTPMLRDMPLEQRLGFKELIADMIDYKEEAFTDYDRPIVDFELVDQGERYHLSVLTQVTSDEKEGKALKKQDA